MVMQTLTLKEIVHGIVTAMNDETLLVYAGTEAPYGYRVQYEDKTYRCAIGVALDGALLDHIDMCEPSEKDSMSLVSEEQKAGYLHLKSIDHLRTIYLVGFDTESTRNYAMDLQRSHDDWKRSIGFADENQAREHFMKTLKWAANYCGYLGFQYPE